ncbi:MAG: serine/threonine protein kinase [Propionibacteriaceae bacterium]|nr:serine/threonine protein kinase [Propionibacteriaceae bacterium]
MTPHEGPPEIPGLSYVRRLGEGGYADVYLYNQAMPARQVALKVIRETNLSSVATAQFRHEADAMARLEHPHIVPVYSVGVTSQGHQYIVMMYYAKENLAKRSKRERLSVPEVLRIGIQIGSAVETAHRAGLLHRDIKPANILVDKYGNPGLADFGIAAQISDSDTEVGVSVPWSPPEILYGTSPASVQSDIYSLAATLWHLLVGRSPFEIPGGDNSPYTLMRRIRDTPAPSPGRADVPASLENLLKSAMAHNPVARPATMLNFVRSLQGVEQELRLPHTLIQVPEETTSGPDPVEARPDATVARPGIVAPQARSAGAPSRPDSTIVRGAQVSPQRAPLVDGEMIEPMPAEPSRSEPIQEATPHATFDRAPHKVRWWVAVLAVLVVAAIIGVGVWWAGSHRPTTTPSTTPVSLGATPQVGDVIVPPGPFHFASSRNDGQVTITWTYDHQRADDTFSWRMAGTTKAEILDQPSLTITDPGDGATLCVEVRVLRANGWVSPSYTKYCP